MNSFFLMLAKSYITKLRTKSFIMTTVLIAGAIILAANFENILSLFDDKDEREKIALIDQSGKFYESYEGQLNRITQEIDLQKVDMRESQLKDEVEKGTFDGYLILKENSNELPQAVYKAPAVTNNSTVQDLQLALEGLKGVETAKQLNLTEDQLSLLGAPADFQKIALANGAKTEEEMMQAQMLVYILLFFIYIAVIFYSNTIASEVAIEKSSRVMEILVSSVSPVKQMFAKILGVGLLGVTQLLIWTLVGYMALKQQSHSGLLREMGLTDISASLLAYAFLFFILGYFLYATIAALLGSIVSRLEDVQQLIMPLTFLVMAGFFIAMYGLSNPEAPLVTISSYIPFFTPMIMFMRLGMLNIPTWEVSVGIGILVASIILLALFGARIYRGGVLMYGKSNSLKDIKKAIQLTKNS
ncbi:MAG TPA: ABC transporter permease [Chondromyces sp.]|nr:ABC transporter permease [Chondromyces sp.]